MSQTNEFFTTRDLALRLNETGQNYCPEEPPQPAQYGPKARAINCWCWCKDGALLYGACEQALAVFKNVYKKRAHSRDVATHTTDFDARYRTSLKGKRRCLLPSPTNQPLINVRDLAKHKQVWTDRQSDRLQQRTATLSKGDGHSKTETKFGKHAGPRF